MLWQVFRHLYTECEALKQVFRYLYPKCGTLKLRGVGVVPIPLFLL